MRLFQLVHLRPKEEHGSDHAHWYKEYKDEGSRRLWRVMDAELVSSIPMKTVEGIEEAEHSEDFDPVEGGILVNFLVVFIVCADELALHLGIIF